MEMKIFLVVLCLLLLKRITMFKKNCDDNQGSSVCLIDNIYRLNEIDIDCETTFYYSLFIIPNSRIIFDNSFRINNSCNFDVLILNNFKGFKLGFERNPKVSYQMVIINNADFIFLYENKNITFEQNFFSLDFANHFLFYSEVKFFGEMSPMAFKNARIQSIEFMDMINSSIKTNYFTFSNIKVNKTYLNCTILRFSFNVFKINLNKKIINEQVLEKVEKLSFLNHISDIEKELFKGFRYLKKVEFAVYCLKSLFNKNTDWIKNLNFDKTIQNVRDQPTNKTDLSLYIGFNQLYMNDVKIIEDYKYPDEDFCRFKDFPHERYVFPILNNCFNTCTYYWLVQYHSVYPESGIDFECEEYIQNLTCDFEIMQKYCIYNTNKERNEAAYEINSDVYYAFYDNNYRLKQFDFILSILILPFVCLLGIVFNTLCIIVLSNRDFKKIYKDRMYTQMLVYSIVNFFICVIYSFRLTIKCIDPISSFCSISIITNKTLRMMFLTIVFYVGSVFRTWSNLIQISIAMDRFILSTDTKWKMFKKFSKINLKYLFTLFLIFSLIINFVNVYEYEYDTSLDSIQFPIISNRFFNLNTFYSYWNIANLFLSNFLILFLQTLLDISLFYFIRQSLKKKLMFNGKQDQKFLEAKKHEKKVKTMILLNGIAFLILHSPDFIVSFFMTLSNSYSYEKRSDLFRNLLKNSYLWLLKKRSEKIWPIIE